MFDNNNNVVTGRRRFVSLAPSLWIGLAIAAAFFLMQCWLAVREDYWGDEGFTVRRIEASWLQLYNPFSFRPPDATDPFDPRYVYDFNPPLYFTLIRLTAGAQPDRLLLRMYSIIPMTAALLLLVFWIRRRWGGTVSIAIALIFILAPPMIYYGHEARPYALGLLIAVVMLYSSDALLSRPRATFIANMVGSVLGCLTHYHFVWFLLALSVVQFMTIFRTERGGAARRAARASIAGMILGIIIAIVTMLPTYATFSMALTLPSRDISQVVAFKTLFAALSFDSTGESHFFWNVLLAATWLILIVLLIVKSRDRKIPAILLAIWLIPAGLPMLAHILLGQSFFERYALFSLPGLFLLVGWALHKSQQQSRTLSMFTWLLVVCLIIYSFASDTIRLRHPLRTPWRDAISALQREGQSGDQYTVQPGWLNLCFAANAGKPPRASCAAPDIPISPNIYRLWIVAGVTLDKQYLDRLAAAGLHVVPFKRTSGYWLWLAQRNDSANVMSGDDQSSIVTTIELDPGQFSVTMNRLDIEGHMPEK